jgi:DNA-binding response OmpR family regulator
MRILIVEDEKILAETLKNSLEKSGYAVDYLMDGEIAERRIVFNSKEYDLIILDWMLPTKDGLQICKDIRQLKIKIPILMLTARFDMKDKVAALDSGADDYLVKPFSLEELEARVRALLRRPVESVDEILETNGLKLDLQKRRVFLDNKNVRLTTKEFALLEYLMRNLDKVVSRDQILDHLWGFDFDSFSNVIDAHIKNLRTKLKSKRRSMIETVRGFGYRIKSS